jgi:hypothetical protein
MRETDPITLMDQLENLVLQQGWPVPWSPYYLVHHEKLLTTLDKLRRSLQDELDARFIHAFGPEFNENAILSRKARSRKER